MTSVFIKILELVDDNNNKIFQLKNCRADRGLSKAINYVRLKDNDNVMKKIAKYLDEDFKNLLGFK